MGFAPAGIAFIITFMMTAPDGSFTHSPSLEKKQKLENRTHNLNEERKIDHAHEKEKTSISQETEQKANIVISKGIKIRGTVFLMAF